MVEMVKKLWAAVAELSQETGNFTHGMKIKPSKKNIKNGTCI